MNNGAAGVVVDRGKTARQNVIDALINHVIKDDSCVVMNVRCKGLGEVMEFYISAFVEDEDGSER